MNSQLPILVYVEDDENSIFVMKMVVERVMKLPILHVLQSRAILCSRLRPRRYAGCLYVGHPNKTL